MQMDALPTTLPPSYHVEYGVQFEAQEESTRRWSASRRSAIVILGGLLSATALNMVVLPALYWLYGDRSVAAGHIDELHDHPIGGLMVTRQGQARLPA